jgi:hypothetical protein
VVPARTFDLYPEKSAAYIVERRFSLVEDVGYL